MKTLPRIVISMGDPAGVGAEIICQALNEKCVRQSARLLIVGSGEIFARAQKIVGTKLNLPVVAENNIFGDHELAIYEPRKWRGALSPWGKWSRKTGEDSLLWANVAAQLCVEKRADALVTAPICKAAWYRAGSKFPGHTELLASHCRSNDEVMMLVGGGLRVALVTIHLPLKKIFSVITPEKIIHHALILHRDLSTRFNIKNPRIGVLGLNPHAGEAGQIGDEEEKIIMPAIKKLRQQKINVSGPLSADTAFYLMLQGNFDALLAMYHDQGLCALKTVAFERGVNITLGLPIIRTSPDHGTAFNIAGKNLANANSMINAIAYAVKLVNRR